jgi:APA family basic amino acid/polyamine antiporter
VLNLAFAFMLTCFALLVLERGGKKKLRGQRLLPIIGIIICVYLLYATSLFNKVVGLTVIALGIPLYVFFSPKADIHHLKEFFLSEEAIFVRRLERKKRFLANFLSLLHRGYRKVKTNEQPE